MYYLHQVTDNYSHYLKDHDRWDNIEALVYSLNTQDDLMDTARLEAAHILCRHKQIPKIIFENV